MNNKYENQVAICAGFAVGRAYHDYSMCTLKRDHRSLGHIATKTYDIVSPFIHLNSVSTLVVVNDSVIN